MRAALTRAHLSRALVTALVAVLFTGGCLKPERDSVEQQRAEALRKRQMVAPSDQGAVMRAARERRKRLDETQRAVAVAEVAGQPILRGDLEDRYNELPLHLRYSYGSPDGLKTLLDEVVDVAVMEAEARRLGMDRDPRVLLPVKVAMVRAFLRAEMPSRVPVAAVTDDDIEREYRAHPERYATPVVVRAVQLVTLAEDPAAAIRKAVLAEAGDDPRRRVELFRRAVAHYSVDSASPEKGGELGTFASGPVEGVDLTPLHEVPAALRLAALRLEAVGAISPVITVGSRYHVLVLTERSGGKPRPFAEVQSAIRSRLYRDRQDAAVTRFVASLRGRADVRIDAAALAGIERPPRPEGSGGLARPDTTDARPPDGATGPGEAPTPPAESGGAQGDRE